MRYMVIGFLALTLAGCGYFGGSSRGTKSEDLIEQAKKNCELLGYQVQTKQYLDCTTGQFNNLQQQYYGPLQ